MVSPSVSPAHTSQSEPPRKRRLSVILIPVVGICLTLAVLLYPVVATLMSNWSHQHAALEYSKLEQQISPQKLAQSFEDAQRYNATKSTGPILDPWLARISGDNVDYQEYLRQLSDLDTMGRLVLPTINVDLPVYHGTSTEVLHRGVGHLYGSDLPVGGPGTHSVLTGHTGLADATLFDHLIDVAVGDPIYIQVAGQKLKYQVYTTEVVLPDQVESLRPQAGQDLLTLITCTPYGINSHRLMVHARRVPMDDSDPFGRSHFTIPGWVWGFVTAAVAAVAALVWWLLRTRLRTRKSTQQ